MEEIIKLLLVEDGGAAENGGISGAASPDHGPDRRGAEPVGGGAG